MNGVNEKPQETLRFFIIFRYKKVDRFHLESVNLSWLRGQDLNLRPSGYEPDELPDCSTPRYFTLRRALYYYNGMSEKMQAFFSFFQNFWHCLPVFTERSGQPLFSADKIQSITPRRPTAVLFSAFASLQPVEEDFL